LGSVVRRIIGLEFARTLPKWLAWPLLFCA